MLATEALAQGRDAYERNHWTDAFEALRSADHQADLAADDLQRLGLAGVLTGHDDEGISAWERAHHALLADGEVAPAVRTAFWIAMTLLRTGQHAPGLGWLGRAQQLADEAGLDGVERGYLGVPAALQALDDDPATALERFRALTDLADGLGDVDGRALGRLGQGRALLALGRTREGVAMLDQAMVEVMSGQVSPLATGIAYCTMIIACRDIFDWQRAREWTSALSRWCDRQPGLQPFRGQCLVHRSELMQLRGEWGDAMVEAQRACDHMAQASRDPAVGMAWYQLAELRRLRGEFDAAERAYRESREWGHPVQPGLALLRLAQGRTADAVAAIRRVAAETEDDKVRRARVLAAYVEILLADDDVPAAREATDELEQLATDFDAPYLHAAAATILGTVALAEGEAGAASEAFRRARTLWQQLEAPYETARVGVLMARACRQLGDHDTAAMDLHTARRTFEELGAGPALEWMAEGGAGDTTSAPGGLTPREVEVLRLVATGATNREVASRLVISEKTVARHLSNIFTKLGITSRAAATAWAYEHDLA